MKVIIFLALSGFFGVFISHMVQMKDWKVRVSAIGSLVFISHMVQMKASMRYASEVPDDLYIPHGSDESWLFNSSILSKICLYIPHGSDERHAVLPVPHCLDIFISHMVQMKEGVH